MTTSTTVAQLLPLAKELDENKVTPGVLGFIVFALLGLAVWMLMKSMNRHMKKVDFEEREPDPEAPKASARAESPASRRSPASAKQPGSRRTT